ncbi:Metallophosphoesterase MPPED2 [Cricetulus griseus]|uniref:Metallophosphoesterase MPPED2 n=1 Tax=Cricetulus griseus TaxID=10029 RepID=G3GZA0_CRIGR|nr:Metallophosphoesterase MPPED2 [Cricetulus griseus]
MPYGDILLHTGDFTELGLPSEVKKFNDWLVSFILGHVMLMASDYDRQKIDKLKRTPWFNGWGFNLPRGQSLLDKWNLIPEGIDILMTHGPPLGFRDWVPKELQRVGCVELLNTVQRRVRPKLHVFGGIHEGYGIMTDGYTTYINASTCTVSFQPTNPPIIFDLPNPQGS